MEDEQDQDPYLGQPDGEVQHHQDELHDQQFHHDQHQHHSQHHEQHQMNDPHMQHQMMQEHLMQQQEQMQREQEQQMLREQQQMLREQQQLREQQLREQELREQQIREQQLRDQQLLAQQQHDQHLLQLAQQQHLQQMQLQQHQRLLHEQQMHQHQHHTQQSQQHEHQMIGQLQQDHHGHMEQGNDDDSQVADDIITAVNNIGDSSNGMDNGLSEHSPQEQAVLAEALAAAAAGSAPPLLLQAEKCLSIQEIVNLCREFEMCDKISRREFAKARDVSRTKFDRYWKNYRIGKYNNVKLANKRRRVKPGKYLAVENKLVEFLEERKAQGIKNDLSWIVLSEKALELSKDCLTEQLQTTFKASAGWLYGVLHRNGFIHVDLTGNDNNIPMGAPAASAPSMKAPPKLTPQPAIVVNGDVTMV